MAGELDRLAGNVKRVREARGLSQRALARKADVAQPTVLAVEKANSPSFDTVLRLARALDVQLWELLDVVPSELEELLPGWNRLTVEQRQDFRHLIAVVAADPASPEARVVATFGVAANAAGLPPREAAEVRALADELEALSDADELAFGAEDANHPDRATGSNTGSANPRGGSGRRPRQPDQGGR